MWPFSRPAQPAETAASAPPPPPPPPTRDEARSRVGELLTQPPAARTDATPFPPGAKYVLAGVGVTAVAAFAGTTLWQVRRLRARQGPSVLESMVAESGAGAGAPGLAALRKGRTPTPALAPASTVTSGRPSQPPAAARPWDTVHLATPASGDAEGGAAGAAFVSSLRSPLGGGEEDEGPSKVSPDAVKLAFQAFAYSLVIVGASSALAWQILRRSLGLNNLYEFTEYLQDHGPFAEQPKRSSEITEAESRPTFLRSWMAARITEVGNALGKPLVRMAKSIPLPSLPSDPDSQVPEHEQEVQDASDWFEQLGQAMEEEVQAEYRERMARRAARQLST